MLTTIIDVIDAYIIWGENYYFLMATLMGFATTACFGTIAARTAGDNEQVPLLLGVGTIALLSTLFWIAIPFIMLAIITISIPLIIGLKVGNLKGRKKVKRAKLPRAKAVNQ